MELPCDIEWATNLVESRMKVSAFISPQVEEREAPQGGTRGWGLPDIPVGASWAAAPVGAPNAHRMPWALGQSPYDGMSFCLQLNLAEIPAQVRKPEWPAVGVVWVFIDLHQETGWKAMAFFEPTPVERIQWHPRLDAKPPKPAVWQLAKLAPDCSYGVLPELHWAPDSYDAWAQSYNAEARKADIQLGGWVWPCQGDFDERNLDFVCAMERQCFGDNAVVYLHHSPERGFYAMVETR